MTSAALTATPTVPPATPAAAAIAVVSPPLVTFTEPTGLPFVPIFAPSAIADTTLPSKYVAPALTPTPAVPPAARLTTVVSTCLKCISAATLTAFALSTSPETTACARPFTTSTPALTPTPAAPPPAATTPIRRMEESFAPSLVFLSASLLISFASSPSASLEEEPSAPPDTALTLTFPSADSFAPPATVALTFEESRPNEMPAPTPAAPPTPSEPAIMFAESVSLASTLIS